MKIYVDGSKRAAVKRLFPVWEKMGHKIVDNPKKANVQLSTIRIKNKSGLPTVLRLDGVYYDKGMKYKSANSSIGKSHHIANAVIYQSNMAKLMCENYLKKRSSKIFDIIYNGVDPTGWNSPEKHKGINIICCAKWRRPKRLEETIQILKIFLKYKPKTKLHVVGRFKKRGRKIPHTNAIYHGQLSFEEMMKVYRTGDVFIHLCKKDSCPSTVVESIAAGIPVVTTNACGGATEMCQFTEGCVVVDGEEESLGPDWVYRKDYNEMPKRVMKRLVNEMIEIVDTKRRVILPEELTVEYAAKKYIDLMEKVVR